MKGLTINRLSMASLRHRRKAYRLLIAGIVLSIYFVCALLLVAMGTLKAGELRFRKAVGHQDAIILDAAPLTPDMLVENGLAKEAGVAAALAWAHETDMLVGYLDETARALLNRQCVAGRLPEKPGEMAAEASALAALRLDATVGDSLTLTLQSIARDAASENTFTLTGILAEQTTLPVYQYTHFFRMPDGMPALLVAKGQPVKPQGPAMQSLLVRYAPGQNDKTFADALRAHGYHSDVLTFSRPLDGDEGTMERLVIAILLGVSLVLTGCVGIASAFQTQMHERRQQMGMMRAVGATRRQLRSIFLREALLVALATAPFALLLAWLTVFAAARMAPDMLLVPDQPWVYAAALAASVAVVLLSAYLPTLRGARVSPMQVLRNLPAQRRMRRKKLQSQRRFKVPSLMARRAAQLYPARQIGLTLIVALLMFLAMGTAPGLQEMLTEQELLGGHVAYEFFRQQTHTIQEGYSVLPRRSGLGQADVAQLERLPYVTEVLWRQSEAVMLLLERGSAYARAAQLGGMQNLREILRRGPEIHDDESLRALNPSLAKAVGAGEELLPVFASITAISQQDLMKLASRLKQGSVNLDSINRGEQVLLCAPRLYPVPLEGGRGFYFSETQDEGASPADPLENDQFAVGDRLRILQAYDLDAKGSLEERRHIYTETTIGGVFDVSSMQLPTDIPLFSLGGPVGAMLTTDAGLRALGLYTDGLDAVAVRVPEPPKGEAEKALTHQLEQVAMRDRSLTFYNRIESTRANAARRLRGLVSLVAVILLFLALSIALVNSSLSSRVRAEKRTIGMLRALGANLRVLRQSYRGQLLAMLLPGVLLGALACLWMGWQNPLMYQQRLGAVLAVEGALLAAMVGAAFLHLHRLLGRMMDSSIVDSIREL